MPPEKTVAAGRGSGQNGTTTRNLEEQPMTRMSKSISLACLATAAFVATLAQSPAAAPEPAAALTGDPIIAATQQPAGNVSRVYFIRVKPGMDAQWMEGAKKHVAWHRQQKDPWTWTAFYVETGRNTGMYGWISQGHTWAELDTYDATIGKGDGENAMATTGPYEESYTSGIAVGLTDVSHPPPAGSTFPLVSVEHFRVHPAKQTQFLNAVRTAHGALQKAGYKLPYMWNREVSGAEGLVFTLAAPMRGWTDMAENPEVEQMMAKQLGEQGMANLMQSFYDSILTVESWTARILPELSYIPGM
jgi:hypothetical protein